MSPHHYRFMINCHRKKHCPLGGWVFTRNYNLHFPLLNYIVLTRLLKFLHLYSMLCRIILLVGRFYQLMLVFESSIVEIFVMKFLLSIEFNIWNVMHNSAVNDIPDHMSKKTKKRIDPIHRNCQCTIKSPILANGCKSTRKYASTFWSTKCAVPPKSIISFLYPEKTRKNGITGFHWSIMWLII